ncbi:hypothetical protein HPB49_019574 [Dermacentor silvarum]|uniref:Uncharacterized protein n=1 Tax=Dermacentor silvarum TaxID=543639 RepID=A0ACB8DFM9_DERSI|nr:hypothetical protein HPB49_019574 [Dermacentor silvarum]
MQRGNTQEARPTSSTCKNVSAARKPTLPGTSKEQTVKVLPLRPSARHAGRVYHEADPCLGYPETTIRLWFDPIVLKIDVKQAEQADQVRVHPIKRTITTSTPDRQRADAYRTITEVQKQKYNMDMPVVAYVPAPDDSIRGVVYRAYTDETDLTIQSELVRKNRQLPIVNARLGNSRNSVITFAGKDLPTLIKVAGGVLQLSQVGAPRRRMPTTTTRRPQVPKMRRGTPATAGQGKADLHPVVRRLSGETPDGQPQLQMSVDPTQADQQWPGAKLNHDQIILLQAKDPGDSPESLGILPTSTRPEPEPGQIVVQTQRCPTQRAEHASDLEWQQTRVTRPRRPNRQTP